MSNLRYKANKLVGETATRRQPQSTAVQQRAVSWRLLSPAANVPFCTYAQKAFKAYELDFCSLCAALCYNNPPHQHC